MKKIKENHQIPENSIFKREIAYMEYMLKEKQNQQQVKSCQSKERK